MRVNYIYKALSDPSEFTAQDSRIELKEYKDDLVFYSPMNDMYRAEFAMYDKIAYFDEKPDVYTGGPFGSYLKIGGSYKFDINNFSSLDGKARISFWLGNNKLVNIANMALVEKPDFPKEGLPAGDYSIVVNVEGRPTSTLVVKCLEGTTTKILRNRILFNLDPIIYPFELNAANNEPDKIMFQSYAEGKAITISDGLDGTNLLKYYDVVPVEYGSAPKFENTIFKFYNLEIRHVGITETGDSRSFLKFIIYSENGKDDQELMMRWNNNSIDLDNIEVDFGDNLVYIFLNGKVEIIEKLRNEFKDNGQTLEFIGGTDYKYSFDEVIVNKKCIHRVDFELPRHQLTKYSREIPYIDYHFSTNELKEGMLLKTTEQNGISCCLCDNGKYYWYNSGAWRTGIGTFNHCNDWDTFSEKIPTFTYSGSDVFLRCFFESDGLELAYLDTPYFEMTDDIYEDNNGDIAAILVGEKEWSDENGDPLKEDLNNKTLIIKTDQGETTIVFDNEEPMTVDEVVDKISEQYPEGVAAVKKDALERVVIVSETKGDDAYITVEGDAAPIIFGEDAPTTAKGSDATSGSVDYSKFYDAVRTYTGAPLITMEVTDEMMKLYLKEALSYYKRFKGDTINQYTCQLEGDWKNGYELPSVIEDQKDITDIIFRPIFPITFYGSDFINESSENIFTLTLAQSLFGGRGGARQAQGLTQDFYISLMGMQDFRQALGLNPTWEIMNNRIYIFPSEVSRFTNVAIKYKAPLSEEEALKDPDIIKYVHGKCLMTLGNIRGQYGSNLTSGEANLTFNSNELYERGKSFVDEVIKYWMSSQPPLGFFFA